MPPPESFERILFSKIEYSPRHRVYLNLECHLVTVIARDNLNLRATFVDEVNDGKKIIRRRACANARLHRSLI